MQPIGKAYVLGAGFSRSFGLPIVQELLGEVSRFCHENGEAKRDRELPGELQRFIERFSPFSGRVTGYEPNAVDVFVALEAAADLKKTGAGLSSLDDIEPQEMLKRLRLTLYQVFHQKLAQASQATDIAGSFFESLDSAGPPVFVSLNWDNSLERGLYNAEHKVFFFETDRKGPATYVFKPHGSIDWLPFREGDRRTLDRYFPLSYPLWKHEKKRSASHWIKDWVELSRLRSVEEPWKAWEAAQEDPRPAAIVTIGQGKAKKFRDQNKRIPRAWEQASRYLEQAKRIIVIGYSMPADDVEVKLLLRGAIWRHEQLYGKPPSVKILNPDKSVWERFREALLMDCELDMRLFDPNMVVD